MKRKTIWNSAIQEGILFLILGGAMLWYGLEEHSSAFIKDWSQSPYLFPVLVAVLTGALSISLLYQGLRAAQGAAEAVKTAEAAARANGGILHAQTIQVLIVLGMSLLYYLALSVLKIPYITFGVFAWSLTISNFEVCTLVFLVVMMLYLGVRRIPVLAAVPLCTTLFLSVAFRAMLHVLLP